MNNFNSRRVEEDEIDLLKLLQALLNKWVVIVLTTLLGAAIAAVITVYMITPTYQAKALMYVNASSLSLGGTKVQISSSELSASKSLVDSYIVILKARNTLDDVIRQTKVPYTYEQLVKMISASSVNGTEIFQVVVTSTDPNEAKLIANTIATTLPNKISAIIEGSSVRIVDSAVTPKSKSYPSNTKNVMMGAFAGAFVSCAIIVVLFLLDDEIHTEDDLTENFNLPLLAAIPDLSEKSSHRYGYGYGYYGHSEKKGDK